MRIGPPAILVLLLIAGLFASSTAVAETSPTPQAVGLNATWMQYLPPPAVNPVICVVDTGVDITPDTAPILVDRLSVTVDQSVDDVAPGAGHGTIVASIIGAPRNGVGSVGLWPHARIVSVRATDDASQIQWQRYSVALTRCATWSGVVAISLSLGGESPSNPYYAYFVDAVDAVRRRGTSVLAAAGNSGGHIDYPAATPGVIPVATNINGGLLCTFASREAGILSAPGCGAIGSGRGGMVVRIDGSSFATPLVATVIASLRAYRPDLSRQQAEDLIVSTSRQQWDGSRAIDVEAAYAAAGLNQIMAEAKAAAQPLKGSAHTVPTGWNGPTRQAAMPAVEVGMPQLRWVRVERTSLVIRLIRPLPRRQRLVVLGRRARILNATTIRAPRVANRWKLSLVAVDTATKRRSRPRHVMIPKRRYLLPVSAGFSRNVLVRQNPSR